LIHLYSKKLEPFNKGLMLGKQLYHGYPIKKPAVSSGEFDPLRLKQEPDT